MTFSKTHIHTQKMGQTDSDYARKIQGTNLIICFWNLIFCKCNLKIRAVQAGLTNHLYRNESGRQ